MNKILQRIVRQLLLAFLALSIQSIQAAEVTRVDVDAKVTNDGRFVVTETHQLTIDKGYESDFREFGLGVDQTIIMRGLTRENEDGSEVPLVDRGPTDEEVDGPDQFRYYPRGHVYYRYPPVLQPTPLRYRFEYEIANAISPAWNLAAGDGVLDSDYAFGSPLRRLREHCAAFKEAWPAPWRRYRLDHSVLMPGRKLNREADLLINYRLEFGTAWREVAPPTEFARVLDNDEYRVRRLYEYLPVGEPIAAGRTPARTRWRSVGAVALVGIGMLLLLLCVDWLTGGRVDQAKIADLLARLSPEEVFGLKHGTASATSMEMLLGRLAGEGKLRIEFLKPKQSGWNSEVVLTRLVPWESLPPLEREFLKELWGENDQSTTSERVRAQLEETGVDPNLRWWQLMQRVASEESQPGFALLSLPLLAIALWAAFRQVSGLQRDEEIIAAILTNVVALGVSVCWPKQWWHFGVPIRGLLLQLIVLAGIFAALHLTINRPYPASTWQSTAVTILALFGAQLLNSRLPLFGQRKHLRQFSQIKRYAERELRRSEPRLDDHWLPHLVALDLGPPIERWRELHPTPISNAANDHPFTGQLPELFPAPAGWADVLTIAPEELADESDDEDDSEDLETDEEDE